MAGIFKGSDGKKEKRKVKCCVLQWDKFIGICDSQIDSRASVLWWPKVLPDSVSWTELRPLLLVCEGVAPSPACLWSFFPFFLLVFSYLSLPWCARQACILSVGQSWCGCCTDSTAPALTWPANRVLTKPSGPAFLGRLQLKSQLVDTS